MINHCLGLAEAGLQTGFCKTTYKLSTWIKKGDFFHSTKITIIKDIQVFKGLFLFLPQFYLYILGLTIAKILLLYNRWRKTENLD